MSSLKQPVISLNGLKSAQLQELARTLGLSSNGNKSALSLRLTTSLPKSRFNRQDNPPTLTTGHGGRRPLAEPDLHYVLSVDMGIRNLAYSLLGVDKSWLTAAPDHHLYSLKPTVQVLQWQRLSLTTLLAANDQATHGGTTDSGALRAAATDGGSTKAQPPELKELFTPPYLAPVAVQILQNLVLQQHALRAHEVPSKGKGKASGSSAGGVHGADTVLIEQQRWRSGGGAAVQEWTLRVNSLEAMLWAGLAVMRAAGVWAGGVHAVSPKAVARFWLPDGLESGKKGKDAKVRVVGAWLADDYDDGDVKLSWAPQADATRRAFLDGGKASKKKAKRDATGAGAGADSSADAGTTGAEADSEQMIAKKDDLADCLLQGMAWIRWEENRRAALTEFSLKQHESKT